MKKSEDIDTLLSHVRRYGEFNEKTRGQIERELTRIRQTYERELDREYGQLKFKLVKQIERRLPSWARKKVKREDI